MLGGSEKEGKTGVWEVRVGTLNVGTMTDKGSRLDAMMERSRVDLFFGAGNLVEGKQGQDHWTWILPWYRREIE